MGRGAGLRETATYLRLDGPGGTKGAALANHAQHPRKNSRGILSRGHINELTIKLSEQATRTAEIANLNLARWSAGLCLMFSIN